MSKVFFSDMRAGHKENLFDKIAKLLTLAGLAQTVAEGDLTAVKIHFGEKGNHTYLRPVFARRVVEEIKKLGALPFLTDSSTLYPGQRKEAVSALTCAHRERLRLCLCRRAADHQRRPARCHRDRGRH